MVGPPLGQETVVCLRVDAIFASPVEWHEIAPVLIRKLAELFFSCFVSSAFPSLLINHVIPDAFLFILRYQWLISFALWKTGIIR